MKAFKTRKNPSYPFNNYLEAADGGMVVKTRGVGTGDQTLTFATGERFRANQLKNDIELMNFTKAVHKLVNNAVKQAVKQTKKELSK